MIATLLIEAISATAASHAPACECYVCRAARGDQQALEQLFVAWRLHKDRGR